MSDLLPVLSVTSEQVRAVIRQAMESPGDLDFVRDYVASIDWSGAFERVDPQIREALGGLENYTTLFDEGDLTEAEYISEFEESAPRNGARAGRLISRRPPTLDE